MEAPADASEVAEVGGCTPAVSVSPDEHSFGFGSCGVAGCVQITVESVSGCPAPITSIEVDAPFEVFGAPQEAIVLEGAGKALTLTVVHRAGSQPAAGQLRVHVQGLDEPVVVALTGPVSTSSCVFSLVNNDPAGILDHQLDLFGQVTRTVTFCNDGPHSVQLGDRRFDGDPEGSHWSIQHVGLSFSVAVGQCVDFDVTYAGTEAGRNSFLVFDFAGPQAAQLRVLGLGGPPKGVLDIAPGTLAKPGTVADRIAVYNVGNGELEVDGGLVGPGGMTIIDVAGKSTYALDYVDQDGQAKTVDIPVFGAAPAKELVVSCDNRVGQPVELAAPEAVFWMVLDKPKDSVVFVNGAAAKRARFVPDKPGTYRLLGGGTEAIVEVEP